MDPYKNIIAGRLVNTMLPVILLIIPLLALVYSADWVTCNKCSKLRLFLSHVGKQ